MSSEHAMNRSLLVGTLAIAMLAASPPRPAQAGPVRIKDIATLQGVQPTPLVGYGLVVGLNKSGDRRQTLFSAQTLANMLERFGVAVPGALIKIENVAAVLVTAEMPAFSRSGARVDVTVSSVGDARSLQGGTLLPTGLRGPDGAVMALAQGPLTLGGFGGGAGGNSVQVNHLTAGRVPGGGVVQTASRAQIPPGQDIVLALHEPDFVSATRVADAINSELGGGAARALDSASVSVRVPDKYQAALPDLMARLEPISVTMDEVARVVINERTGTVVVGAHVTLGAAAVAHGNLSVSISTRYDVSQPAPMSQGKTAVVPQTDVNVKEGGGQLVAFEEGTTLADVVRALNALGATPRDIIAIMQALKAAGALKADLVII
jgi:flagellar P-ring protein FlgI